MSFSFSSPSPACLFLQSSSSGSVIYGASFQDWTRYCIRGLPRRGPRCDVIFLSATIFPSKIYPPSKSSSSEDKGAVKRWRLMRRHGGGFPLAAARCLCYKPDLICNTLDRVTSSRLMGISPPKLVFISAAGSW